MTSKPPWEIHPKQLFRIFNNTFDDPAKRRKLTGSLLILVNNDGTATDNFHFKLYGDEAVDCQFPSGDIFAHKSLQGFTLSTDSRPEDINLRTNSFSSKWVDIIDLVENGSLQVTSSSIPDASSHFRDLLKGLKGEPGSAAAVRWSVLATSTSRMKLIFASLPESATTLRRSQALNADSAPIIELGVHGVSIDMVLERPLTGPHPILFSADVEEISTLLRNHPSTAVPGIQRILRSIPETERIHLEEAGDAMEDPEARTKVYPFGAESIHLTPKKGQQPHCSKGTSSPKLSSKKYSFHRHLNWIKKIFWKKCAKHLRSLSYAEKTEYLRLASSALSKNT